MTLFLLCNKLLCTYEAGGDGGGGGDPRADRADEADDVAAVARSRLPAPLVLALGRLQV